MVGSGQAGSKSELKLQRAGIADPQWQCLLQGDLRINIHGIVGIQIDIGVGIIAIIDDKTIGADIGGVCAIVGNNLAGSQIRATTAGYIDVAHDDDTAGGWQLLELGDHPCVA